MLYRDHDAPRLPPALLASLLGFFEDAEGWPPALRRVGDDLLRASPIGAFPPGEDPAQILQDILTVWEVLPLGVRTCPTADQTAITRLAVATFVMVAQLAYRFGLGDAAQRHAARVAFGVPRRSGASSAVRSPLR
jgi:hypothetical protein